MKDDEIDRRGLNLIHSMTDVSRETDMRFLTYVRLLRQWQAKMNLVAPSTMEAVWERHIADSFQVYLAAPHARHWIDIGSGAGFPGMILAILLAEKYGRESKVHLIESVGKKCAFMNAVGREVGLKDAGVALNVHRGRIETTLPNLDVPEVISARALAPLSELINMTQHHLSNGATGLFSKGQDYESELAAARKDWNFDTNIHTSQLAENSVILEISNLHKKPFETHHKA